MRKLLHWEIKESKLFIRTKNTTAETPNTKVMTQTDTKQKLIEASNGKFFKITYKNKLGDVSNYVVRTGVKKNLKGGTNYAPKGTVTLYSVSKDGDTKNFGYRTLYLDNIHSIEGKCQSMTWMRSGLKGLLIAGLGKDLVNTHML